MAAYWIAHVTVLNAEKYAGYTALAPAAFAKYGATFLARGGKAVAVEGESADRHVVIAFEDMETALACYHSPEYQAAKAHRDANCVAEIVIVEGI
ncbi:DUF1330 domain-containing protein [Stenotrophomonas sp. PS02289]|uniref:DUF1330 domain-containing protein n=1 Tax=Stenotrophomonas sp. PS02289 TaxID=2991422 RepID=UPI00249BBD06|nr:DUF1330 domain-containing protein [Stenotrophomonas sp. PS02289]